MTEGRTEGADRPTAGWRRIVAFLRRWLGGRRKSPLPKSASVVEHVRYTDRARKVLELASQQAQRLNHEYLGTEHLLLGLIADGRGVAAAVLKALDVDRDKVRAEVERLVRKGPEPVPAGLLPRTPRAKQVVEYAQEEALALGHNYVGTEHLLLGLLRGSDAFAAQVLMNFGLTPEKAREQTVTSLGRSVEGRRTGAGQQQPRLATGNEASVEVANMTDEEMAAMMRELGPAGMLQFLKRQQTAKNEGSGEQPAQPG